MRLQGRTNPAKFPQVSTTALHVIELVKSLSETDQQAIRDALVKPSSKSSANQRRQLERLPDGSYVNPNGIPNDDQALKILEEIEDARHKMPGPSAPSFD